MDPTDQISLQEHIATHLRYFLAGRPDYQPEWGFDADQ